MRRLGITLSRAAPEFERFLAACLRVELAYLDLFRLRESRQGGLDHPHPDTVTGPWRMVAALQPKPVLTDVQPVQAGQLIVTPLAGKTLSDCRAKWVENRAKVKKQVNAEYVREMDNTIAAFEAHAKARRIGEVRRQHVLAYRDHLSGETDYKTQTICQSALDRVPGSARNRDPLVDVGMADQRSRWLSWSGLLGQGEGGFSKQSGTGELRPCS